MLEGLFDPRGVVVVGASRDPAKLGYGVARNLVVSGYPGVIHFVNPRGGTLFDRPFYLDLAGVPDPVDLAVVMIPAAKVPQALNECGQRGIHYVIVGAGGFRETGEQGRALEARCLEIAREHGIRVLGPNCIGYLDTHIPIDTSFLPLPGPIQGDIAFLSHSGAICETVIDWARGQGFGLSRLVSLGNQMDLNEGEVLPAVAADPNTRVVAMYMEGVGDGATFIQQAQMVTPEKPVVAIKVGRSLGGRKAVASHTGALAGRDEAFDAAFRKAGVIRARHSEEMFDWARALAWCRLPRGPNMAVLTNAGGPGAIAADALDANGLKMPELQEQTRLELAQILPEAASLRNPVDMLAGAGPREYADCLRLLLADEGIDGIIVILPPPPVTTAAEVAGAIIPVIRSAKKPVVLALMGEELIAHAARLFRQSRIPDYRFPERAASVLRVLYERSKQLERHLSKPVTFSDVKPEVVDTCLETARVGRDGFITAACAHAVAEAYGLPTLSYRVVRDLDQALEAAREFGYPVVLKLDSPDLPHKSDLGVLALGLASPEDVGDAYQRILHQANESIPDVYVEGLMVQPEHQGGQEVIVGFVRDEQFGPMLMFGTGGVEVEALQDVAFELAPLSREEAEGMVDRTLAGRKMRGFRNTAPSDRETVIEVLLRMSQLALNHPRILELEINPLRVMPAGEGALALDVRIRLDPATA
ncbi:MAG: CoA-binding protein [Anaerolineales bacterium]|nr:MAG: CoA-binding protein [Anaerolineales bacterium]